MSETNLLTNNVIKYLKIHGYFASRIQSQGQYLESKRMWIKSKVRRGIGDIIACIDGKFVMIEIKFGKDRQSEWQKLVEKEVIKSKGHYWLIKTMDDLLKKHKSLNETNICNSNTQKSTDNIRTYKKTVRGTRSNSSSISSVRKGRRKGI